MAAIELLPVGTGAAASASFAINSNDNANVLFITTNPNRGGLIIEAQGSSGNWYPVDNFKAGQGLMSIDGPGIFRVSRSPDAAACGADLITAAAWGPPSIIEAPVVSGTRAVGETLTVSDGVWANAIQITYTYQWTSDGVDITGAASNTYVMVAGDDAHDIECTVTATTPYGSASASSTL